MKKVKKIKSVLFDHGVVFYGVAAVLLLVAIINVAPKKSSALTEYDLTGISREKATLLKTQIVYTGEMNKATLESAQGFAATDKHLVVVIAPSWGNTRNQEKNEIRLINPSSMRDESANYGNPKFKMGHANGTTYNSKTKELVTALSLDPDEFKGQIVRVNTSDYKTAKTSWQIGMQNNTPVRLYGIAYDDDLDRYYTYNGSYARVMDTTSYKSTNIARHVHNQVDQGMAYHKGYFYRTLWEAKGQWQGHPEKSGLFSAFDGVIYQFSAKTGEYTGAYYTANPSCELEGMAIYNDVPYLLYNSCNNGKREIGYFTIAKVTNSNLQKAMYHRYNYSYDTAGGTWSGEAPAAGESYVGMDFKLTKKKPTRQYYDFLGWKVTGSDKLYGPASTYSTSAGASTKDRTFTAQWKVQNYTVSYNKNNGTGGPGSVILPKTENATISDGGNISRVGYSFKGWSRTKNSSTVDFAAGDVYDGRENITLFAVWEKVKQTVKFNFRGGATDSGNSFQSITKWAIEDVTLPTASPVREYYDFLGWTNSKNSNEVVYPVGQTNVYKGHKDITLYAVWKVQHYEISFNENGGSNPPKKITHARTVSRVAMPKSEPVRSGYTFKGWANSSSATTAAYLPGETYTFSDRASRTLYAVWEQNVAPRGSYLIFDANGGKGGPGKAEADSDGKVTIPATVPTRDGYNFVAWNMSPDGTGTSYVPGRTLTIGGDIVLYAAWSVDKITLSYDANGGTNAPASHSAASSQISVSTQIPERTNYTFLGWAIDGETKVSYYPGQKFTEGVSTKLVAVWRENLKKITYYRISSDEHAVPNPIVYKQESVAQNTTATVTETQPTRSAFYFRGWSLDSDAVSVDYLPGEDIEIEDTDIVLYGVWGSKFYTVYFDSNGSMDEAPMQISEIGDILEIPSSDLHRVNYEFVGWNSDPDATTAEYVNGDPYERAEDIILYATWLPTGVCEEIEDDENYHYTPDFPIDEGGDGEQVPVNPKTEALNISSIMLILSGASIAFGVLIARLRRR